jgi:hypothetical protein
MNSELRLLGDQFWSCLIIAASVGGHRLIPNVTVEPECDSIPQSTTPANWVVQEKTSPHLVSFFRNGRGKPHGKPDNNVSVLCIHTSLSTKIVSGLCYTRE